MSAQVDAYANIRSPHPSPAAEGERAATPGLRENVVQAPVYGAHHTETARKERAVLSYAGAVTGPRPVSEVRPATEVSAWGQMDASGGTGLISGVGGVPSAGWGTEDKRPGVARRAFGAVKNRLKSGMQIVLGGEATDGHLEDPSEWVSPTRNSCTFSVSNGPHGFVAMTNFSRTS